MAQSRVDYSNGLVYCIYDNNTNECLYVGSTTNFHSRKNQHNKISRDLLKNAKYVFNIHRKINELGWDNITMELHHYFPCESKLELEREEGIWTRQLKPTCNHRIAGRTHAEWASENKEHLQDYHAEWWEKNKEIESEKRKQWRIDNPELQKERKKAEYDKNRENYQARAKEYYADHKEERKEYHDKWYEANRESQIQKGREKYLEKREAILAENRSRVRCEICDVEMAKSSLSRHKKSAPHLENMNKKKGN
jgi:hypothetical protein